MNQLDYAQFELEQYEQDHTESIWSCGQTDVINYIATARFKTDNMVLRFLQVLKKLRIL